MKLVLDERVKHRLVGLSVIISIAIIFAPAIMKKSRQRIDERINMSVKLPPKPILPKVAMPSEKNMFESVKVAHVEIPAVNDEPAPIATIARAESLSAMREPANEQLLAKSLPSMQEKPSHVAVIVKKTNPVKFAPRANIKPVVKPVAIVNQKSIAIKNRSKIAYAVQLAMFTKQNNAITLVNTLRKKGYQAQVNKIINAKGTAYKVIVGHTNEKNKAQQLQKQLAGITQIKGFIITKGIG